MDESKLLRLLEDPRFVSGLVDVKSPYDLECLLGDSGVILSDEESRSLFGVVSSIREDALAGKRMLDRDLSNISGGKCNGVVEQAGKCIGKPVYYTGYGVGYVAAKVPVVGALVYYSVRDAIMGFYDSLHNY